MIVCQLTSVLSRLMDSRYVPVVVLSPTYVVRGKVVCFQSFIPVHLEGGTYPMMHCHRPHPLEGPAKAEDSVLDRRRNRDGGRGWYGCYWKALLFLVILLGICS